MAYRLLHFFAFFLFILKGFCSEKKKKRGIKALDLFLSWKNWNLTEEMCKMQQFVETAAS